MRGVTAAIACVLACGLSCAPTLDSPLEHQRALDRDDSAQLAGQLAELPGAVRADVVLHRPARDPLTRAQVAASAAIVIVVDDSADRPAIAAAARRLAHGIAPEIAAPEVAVELGAERPQLATVGPFTVAARDRTAVVATVAGALALLALLAGYIAWRER